MTSTGKPVNSAVLRIQWATAAGQYSTDGGYTWTQFTKPSTMTYGQGKVAVSADGSTIVWNPNDGSTPVYTTDKGATWTAATGLPTGIAPVADPVNSNDFYAIDQNTGVVYTSTDGGETFSSAATGLTASSNDELLTIPGRSGELDLAAQTGGLFLSKDGGATFTQVDAPGTVSADEAVTAGYAIGEGAAAPGSRYQTLYMVGTVGGVTGFYMSTDGARSWTKINSSKQNWGWIPTIIGDPHTFGRVYVGTGGRGIQTIDVAQQ